MMSLEKMSAGAGNDKPFVIGQLFRSPSALKSSSSSANVLAALQILRDIGETLKNVPYLTNIAGTSVQILEIREEISNNRALCRELVENVAKRSRSLVEALQKVENFPLEHLRQDLHAYATLLSEIHIALLNLTRTRLRGFITVVNRDVRRDLQDFSRRLDEFDRIFDFSRLTNLELSVGRILAQVDKPDIISPKAQDSCSFPPPTQMFTGRGDVLQKLDNFFDVSSSSLSSKQQRVFVLYGMGGAGKTQIALKFLERASSRFSTVYYINANTVESLTSSLQCISPNAGASDADVTSTLRWLANQREEWLLLFDSVDMHDTDLHRFFPPCSHGNILITSRNPEMRRHAPTSHYHVGAMDPREAVSLLLISSKCKSAEGNQEKAELLAAELGYLALAIVQAGSFISKSPRLGLDGYLSLYKTNRSELLRHRSVQNSDNYEWTVYTTWEISFQQLSTTAATFLQLCAYWHHENIAKAIFQNALTDIDDFALEELPEGWKDVLQFLRLFRKKEDKGSWDDLVFQRTINELSSFSLMQPTNKDAYSIHPLVHSWTKDSHTSHSIKLCSGHLLALSIRSKHDTNDYTFRKGLLRHVIEWLSSDYSDVDLLLSSRFAIVFQERGRWKEAETLWELAVEKAIALYGDCHPKSLSSVVNLASVYRNQGRWDDAEKLLLSVVQMQQIVLGKDHPNTLTTMKDLASVYHAQERWEDAAQLCSLVLGTQQNILGKLHPATLNTMTSLVAIYNSQGRWEIAKVLALSAVTLQRELAGEEHPDTLRTMATFVSTCCSLGQWAEAEKLGSSVLEMRKRVLGEYHPNTLTSMSDLAVVYEKLGRWSEAQQLLELVISKQRDLLGEDHPDTMRSVSSLQFVQQQQQPVQPVQVKGLRSKIKRMSGLWKNG